VQYRVLGPIEVEVDGRRYDIPAAKERLVLAALLTSPNRVVSVADLIEELWGYHPPASAAKTLQTYISHLRRLLSDRLETKAPGYLIRAEQGELDAAEFESTVAAGRLALLRDDAATAARLLGESLSAWRGAAFLGVDSDAIVRAESVRLEELRMAATEDWYEARLGSGDPRDVVAELEPLLLRHPLRERLWSLLMQALYGSGRQSDALRAFQHARSILVDELGIEPGPELRATEAAVLDQTLTNSSRRDARRPATSYAVNADGLQIGYWTHGTGSNDIVFLGDIYMNLDLVFEFTSMAAMLNQLEDEHRVLSVQRRGTGVSDREPDGTVLAPQRCVGDIDVALQAAGASEEKVALLGWGHGGQLALAYAGARPERVSKLVVVNSYARLSSTTGYDGGIPAELLEPWLAFIARKWGRAMSAAPIFGPLGDEPRFTTQLARLERLTASPSEAVELHRSLNDFDVRDLVAAVRCPSLVVYLDRSASGRSGARWLAENLPDADYAELPGHFLPTTSEAEALGTRIAVFLRHQRA
jgi:DNA-binding SARP family transcriptional activator/pimeloyl-ACP methyl ester carboxylesterase